MSDASDEPSVERAEMPMEGPADEGVSEAYQE